MNRCFSFCILTAIFFCGVTSVAIAGPDGCKLQGSWYGTGDITLLTTYNGMSANSGTIIEELPGFDYTIYGNFPAAVGATTLRGTWQRTGGNTFIFTQVGYGLDEDGNIVYKVKNSGTKTLSEDCNLMEVVCTMEFYGPDDDPFAGPGYCMELDPLAVYRMMIDAPCSVD